MLDDVELDDAPGPAPPSSGMAKAGTSETASRIDDTKSEKKKKKKKKKEKHASPLEPLSVAETETFPDADTTAEQTAEEEDDRLDEAYINPYVPESMELEQKEEDEEEDEGHESEGEEEEADNGNGEESAEESQDIRPSVRMSDRKSSFDRKSYAGRFSRFSMRRNTPEDMDGGHISGEESQGAISQLTPRQQHHHGQGHGGSYAVGFHHGPNVSHHQIHPHHKDETFYLIPRVVTIQYGPYPVYGILDYRLERLQGIQKMLQKAGAKVLMVPSTDFVNHVHVWYLEHLIFACNVTDLMHGGDGEMDPLCITASRAFEHVSKRAVHGLRNRCSTPDPDMQNPYCACANAKDKGQGHAPLLPAHSASSTRDTFSVQTFTKKAKAKKQEGDDEE